MGAFIIRIKKVIKISLLICSVRTKTARCKVEFHFSAAVPAEVAPDVHALTWRGEERVSSKVPAGKRRYDVQKCAGLILYLRWRTASPRSAACSPRRWTPRNPAGLCP